MRADIYMVGDMVSSDVGHTCIAIIYDPCL